MNNLVLCIGSNTSNRKEIINCAIERLGKVMQILRMSSIYECASHSGIGNPYFNIVIICNTTLSYEQVYSTTKAIEKDMGRTPNSKTTGIMPLDIDIVLWNNELKHPQDFELHHFTFGYNQIKQQN